MGKKCKRSAVLSAICVIMCMTVLLMTSSCAFDNTSASQTHSVKNTKMKVRTTNSAGNASKEFVNTLQGYEMEVAFPYELNSSQKQLYDDAVLAVNKEFGCKISITYGEYDTDKLISSIDAKKPTAKVCFAKTDKLLKIIDSDSATDLKNPAKTAGVVFSGDWYDKQMCETLNINFKQYGFVSPLCDGSFSNCIIYNRSMLDNSKSGNIIEDAENGDWDIDELFSVISSTTAKDKRLQVADSSALFESLCAAKGQTLVSFATSENALLNLGNLFVRSAADTMDDWLNKSKSAVDVSTQKNYGLDKFLQGESAFYFANSKAFSSFLSLKSKSGSKDEFGVIQFPNAIASHSYKNVTENEYFTFVPVTYSSQADKIVFLYNELLRQISVNSYNLFSLSAGGALGVDAVEYAYNMKWAKSGNKMAVSITKALESYSSVGSGSIAQSIANGEGSESALGKYSTAVKKYYSENLKEYVFTGTFDLLFG